jgi:glutathione S-transferase
MELYHNNMSVCAQKVRVALREKGLRPSEHHLNLRAGDATRPEYLRLNPNGVVPTLLDRGVAIVESTVICEYLDDAYPDTPLRPADPVQRAQMRVWTLVPDAGLHRACGLTSFSVAFRHQMLALPQVEIDRQLAEKPDPQLRQHVQQTLELGIDAPGVREALKLYQRVVQRAAQQLERTAWLAGAEYSLADGALLPYVCRLEDLGMEWLWAEGGTGMREWLARSKARPGYAGIADYLDRGYLELMGRCGRELRKRIEKLLAS